MFGYEPFAMSPYAFYAVEAESEVDGDTDETGPLVMFDMVKMFNVFTTNLD